MKSHRPIAARSRFMWRLSLLLTGIPTLLGGVAAEHWAVIVAGSRGFENYRHQADACHAYHVVRRHGIPAENVVLMMYDEVAHADENPFKGKLFNKPSNTTPVDVYAGCQVDYRGDDVTPDNFLSVLLGDSAATKGNKVLASGPNDRVFVNFVDHGARGFVVFPHGEMLTASMLTGTLNKMHAAKRYKELVFYVEACHSGSMFWSWSMSHINAYVTTAANGWESSWGTYCPPMDVVNGTAIGTCLGDLYSVNWMEDSDLTDLSGESLSQQFNLVKKRTSKSHVEQFGSSHVRREIVGNFQSNYDVRTMIDDHDETERPQREGVVSSLPALSAVDAHNIPLVAAFYRYLRATKDDSERHNYAAALLHHIEMREREDQLFDGLEAAYERLFGHKLPRHGSPPANTMTECSEGVFTVFGDVVQATHGYEAHRTDMPTGFSAYSLQYAGVLLDLCSALHELERVRSFLRCALTESCGAIQAISSS